MKMHNLERLELHGMSVNDNDDGFKLLAGAIRNGKLKTLIMRNSLIHRNMNIFNALPGSALETLFLENINAQQDLMTLIEVLPYTPSLKHLYLMGGDTIFNHGRLIHILASTQIEELLLISVNLTPNEAILLSSVVPSTKLKYLDIRHNNLENIITMSHFGSAMNLKPEFEVVLSD